MEIGYIKLYRKITNSFVWTNPNMLKLWMLCLMKASHSGNKFLFNGQEIVVSSGQFVTGGHAIAKEFNEGVTSDNQIVGRTLWRWMKKFEKEEMLSIKSNTKYSVITIKNWGDYQSNDNQVSSGRQATVKPVSTNKNEKNVKNEKNKDIPPKSNKRIYETDSIHYQLASDFFEKIKINNPEAKQPNLQKWADDIRKMIELDNRTPEQVKNMISWSQAHEFWSGVVLSTGNLRKQYDKMKVQALNSSKPNKKQPYNNQSIRKETLPDWAQEEYMPPETKSEWTAEKEEEFQKLARGEYPEELGK